MKFIHENNPSFTCSSHKWNVKFSQSFLITEDEFTINLIKWTKDYSYWMIKIIKEDKKEEVVVDVVETPNDSNWINNDSEVLGNSSINELKKLYKAKFNKTPYYWWKKDALIKKLS